MRTGRGRQAAGAADSGFLFFIFEWDAASCMATEVWANKKLQGVVCLELCAVWDLVLRSDEVVETEPGFDIIQMVVKREIVNDQLSQVVISGADFRGQEVVGVSGEDAFCGICGGGSVNDGDAGAV